MAPLCSHYATLLPCPASCFRLTESADSLRMRTQKFAPILEVLDNRGELVGGVFPQKTKARLCQRTIQRPYLLQGLWGHLHAHRPAIFLIPDTAQAAFSLDAIERGGHCSARAARRL